MIDWSNQELRLIGTMVQNRIADNAAMLEDAEALDRELVQHLVEDQKVLGRMWERVKEM